MLNDSFIFFFLFQVKQVYGGSDTNTITFFNIFFQFLSCVSVCPELFALQGNGNSSLKPGSTFSLSITI